ncbi:NnrU family protein [Jannaschia rubra]|uniref:NnrU family protein n=1 Tax=Jannaschia rubra TaxID=282197 RepID=UPI00248F48D9|nr:NnrU family protein [Jannaschia rubra]
MGWAELVAAFAAFFVSHSVPLRPPVRARLVGVLGRRGFTLAYSALSLAALVWLIVAAGRAPFVQVWPRLGWQPWVPLLAMAGACALLALAIGRPNPFSFGGPSTGFDPARPGVVRVVRHPLLVAMALWAGAHLVPNGDLAHVLLFGSFAGFALLGIRIVDRRRRRIMGPEVWDGLAAEVRAHPPRPASWGGAAVRLGAAAALYLVLIALHPAVIGVSPLP